MWALSRHLLSVFNKLVSNHSAANIKILGIYQGGGYKWFALTVLILTASYLCLAFAKKLSPKLARLLLGV